MQYRNEPVTQFKYIDRGYPHTTVLIPGWANDYRIFGNLDLGSNYLIPLASSPFTFEKDLLAALKDNNISRAALLGISMGGFMASQFASRHSDLTEEIILVGIRKKYKQEEIAGVRENLQKSKESFLYKFYKMCFSKEDIHFFNAALFKAYSKEMDLENLLKDLDYLGNAEIKPEGLAPIKKIKIIHGEFDRIAPIDEAVYIKERLPQAGFACVKGAGHALISRKDFPGLI
jgi:pimeloyl-ACP methyl ester carboxylesterase